MGIDTRIEQDIVDLEKGLVDKGIDAYWMDGTEPEFEDSNTQEKSESEILRCKDTGKNCKKSSLIISSNQ